MLRIAAAASEPALYAEPNPARDSEIEKAGPVGAGYFYLCSGGAIVELYAD
jgi:hypothetical protein